MFCTLRESWDWILVRRATENFSRSHRVRRIVENWIRSAESHLKNGDPQKAFRVWRAARAQYPKIVAASRPGLFLLLRLPAFDEAEDMMQEGCQQSPRDPFFFEGAALVAAWRGADQEAAERYATLRKRFPSCREGYVGGARVLIKLGRLDEADHVLSHVAHGDTDLAVEHARLAVRRKDWPTALRRWQRLHEVTGHWAAPPGLAECYRLTGRFDEAERLLVNALKEPRRNALECRIELAMIAEGRNDWTEAARRWQQVRLASPSVVNAYRRGVAALSKAQQLAQAEELLREARVKFPREMAS